MKIFIFIGQFVWELYAMVFRSKKLFRECGVALDNNPCQILWR